MHYVIGDVHGCYDEMIDLVHKIETEDADANFIFVGDFIDRGPQVDKVLHWVINNVTLDGKYQSVLGNHEAMVLNWYHNFIKWWNECGFNHPYDVPMPQTQYDFSMWANRMGILTPEKLTPYIDFFRSLPYNKAFTITSIWGKKNVFRIVHACYDYGVVSEEQQHHANLWARQESGNCSEEIVIHGHTPTLDIEYIYSGVKDTNPGMISYRKNDINVDGGCVFAREFPMYPAMLCAIRLEDLEEIYVNTVEEKFLQFTENSIEFSYQEERMERYRKDYLQNESKFRKLLLQKIGHPDYQNIDDTDEHIPGKPRFIEDDVVTFKYNGEELVGSIEIVNAFGVMGYIEQPYYDILTSRFNTTMLIKEIPESDIIC